MTAVHVPTNQRCDMVDARISSGRVWWESGPKNVVQIILAFDPIKQILRELTLDPVTLQLQKVIVAHSDFQRSPSFVEVEYRPLSFRTKRLRLP